MSPTFGWDGLGIHPACGALGKHRAKAPGGGHWQQAESRGAAGAVGCCSCASERVQYSPLPREQNSQQIADGQLSRQTHKVAGSRAAGLKARRARAALGEETRVAVEEPGRQVRGAPGCLPSGRRTGAALRGRRGSAAPASSSPLRSLLRHRFFSRISPAAGSAFPSRAVPWFRGSSFPPSLPLLFPQPLDFIAPSVSFFPPDLQTPPSPSGF